MPGSASYITFDMQLINAFTLKPYSAAGGTFYVAMNGTRNKATLYNPDSNFASLANPVAMTGGKVRFAVQIAAPGGQPSPPSVDIYGIASDGRWFLRQGCTPGDVPDIYIDANERDQTAIIPWAFVDSCGANVETTTGFALPAGCLIEPAPAVQVVTVDSAGHTISFGTLSSQTGGNATGFASAISIATAATVKGTVNGASPTLGSLLRVIAGTSAVSVAEQYPLLSTAPILSYTPSASAVSGDGFLILPYTLPL